jgi:CubicO group peptidase (beta-lactamase class C family)
MTSNCFLLVVTCGALFGTATTAGQPAAAHATTDADVRAILADRIDRQRQGVGIVVGIVEPSGRRTISYGRVDTKSAQSPDGDTIFEIGSITKVFTALLLAAMVQRGEVALTDPVARYLPAAVRVPERGGRKITLEDLAMHMSGLPFLPSNLSPKNAANSFADYTVQQMYAFLSSYELPRDIGSRYEYSNVGAGLLGHALARRAGTDYETLVRTRICKPLGMNDTRIGLSEEVKRRFAAGHNEHLEPVPHWDVPTLAGAVALRSTANDLLLFLAATLGYTKSALAPAMARMLVAPRPAGEPSVQIVLGWHVLKANNHDLILHNGGTGGFRSFMGYNASSGTGVVVLSNTHTSVGVDDIGRHLLDPTLTLAKTHQEITVDPSLFDRYIGRYELAPDFTIAVTRDGAHLFGEATGQPRVELFAESDREYFVKEADAQVTFEVDDQGRATAVILQMNGVHTRGRRIE